MDKRALKTLLDTYWSAAGWKQAPKTPSGEAFEHAKRQGVMFDPLWRSHDETIVQLRQQVRRLTERQIADGFLASLSTRRLDWRSALGSFSVAQWLPDHRVSAGAGQCPVCGLDCAPHFQDLNVLNFERLKWGGVRHADPMYALLDLELFLAHPPTAPTADDVRIFLELMTAITSVAPSVTASALHQHFLASLKANKAERDRVVAILGLCGVLDTPAHPGFGEAFVPIGERVLPNHHFVDMAYPACWWSGSAGINQRRLSALFGHVL